VRVFVCLGMFRIVVNVGLHVSLCLSTENGIFDKRVFPPHMVFCGAKFGLICTLLQPYRGAGAYTADTANAVPLFGW